MSDEEELARLLLRGSRVGTDPAGVPLFSGHFGLHYEDGEPYTGRVVLPRVVTVDLVADLVDEMMEPLDPEAATRTCQEWMMLAALPEPEEEN